MKNYQFILIIIVLTIVITGTCIYFFEPRLSEKKTELGFVFEKSFVPEISSTSTGFGFSSNGDPVITTHHNHEAAKYITFFKCQHNQTFWVENREIWERLERGDSVVIEYYDKINRRGTVIDYQFENAYEKGND